MSLSLMRLLLKISDHANSSSSFQNDESAVVICLEVRKLKLNDKYTKNKKASCVENGQ